MVADVHMDWTQLTLYRIIYHLFFFGVGCMLCKNRKLLSNPHIVGAFLMGLAVAWYFYGFYYVRSWYANWKLTIALGTCWVYLYRFYRFPRLERVSGSFSSAGNTVWSSISCTRFSLRDCARCFPCWASLPHGSAYG